MSNSSGNSGSVFTLSSRAARRMGHDKDEKDSWCPVIGFRLAHDNVDQVCRGGSGNYDPPFARGAGRYGNGPDFRGVFLGFRLAWDRT